MAAGVPARLTAAQGRRVHDVVVNQREVVEALHRVRRAVLMHPPAPLPIALAHRLAMPCMRVDDIGPCTRPAA